MHSSFFPAFLLPGALVAYCIIARALAKGKLIVARRTKTVITILLIILAILTIAA